MLLPNFIYLATDLSYIYIQKPPEHVNCLWVDLEMFFAALIFDKTAT